MILDQSVLSIYLDNTQGGKVCRRCCTVKVAISTRGVSCSGRKKTQSCSQSSVKASGNLPLDLVACVNSSRFVC